jgi:hypothetical protein
MGSSAGGPCGVWAALFIATALATIVSSARGSVAEAIILYEAALGLGIAVGPLVGGVLGLISWWRRGCSTASAQFRRCW